MHRAAKCVFDHLCFLPMQAKKSGVKIIGGITKAKVLDADIETCGPTIVHQIDSVLVPCPVSLGK